MFLLARPRLKGHGLQSNGAMEALPPWQSVRAHAMHARALYPCLAAMQAWPLPEFRGPPDYQACDASPLPDRGGPTAVHPRD